MFGFFRGSGVWVVRRGLGGGGGFDLRRLGSELRPSHSDFFHELFQVGLSGDDGGSFFVGFFDRGR